MVAASGYGSLHTAHERESKPENIEAPGAPVGKCSALMLGGKCAAPINAYSVYELLLIDASIC